MTTTTGTCGVEYAVRLEASVLPEALETAAKIAAKFEPYGVVVASCLRAVKEVISACETASANQQLAASLKQRVEFTGRLLIAVVRQLKATKSSIPPEIGDMLKKMADCLEITQARANEWASKPLNTLDRIRSWIASNSIDKAIKAEEQIVAGLTADLTLIMSVTTFVGQGDIMMHIHRERIELENALQGMVTDTQEGLQAVLAAVLAKMTTSPSAVEARGEAEAARAAVNDLLPVVVDEMAAGLSYELEVQLRMLFRELRMNFNVEVAKKRKDGLKLSKLLIKEEQVTVIKDECTSSGAFSEVFEATFYGKQTVALKAFKQGGSTLAELRTMIENEAVLLERLHTHPGVVSLHGIVHKKIKGTLRYALVLEWYGGGTLHSLLQTGLAHDKALDLALQIAQVMEFVHSQGVVHGDIKPSNVLLEAPSPGKPTICALADFGLARLVATATQSTMLLKASDVKGATPTYQAPEVTEGHGVSKASDVFAFGVLVLELLTGIQRRGPLKENEVAKSKLLLSGGEMDLILQCTALEPGKRLPFAKIVPALELLKLQDDLKHQALKPAVGQPSPGLPTVNKTQQPNGGQASAIDTVVTGPFGGLSGGEFTDPKESDITVLHVWADDFVDAIGVQHGAAFSGWYGQPGGTQHSLQLEEGEYIIAAGGELTEWSDYKRRVVSKLRLITNKRKSLTVGGTPGEAFIATPPPPRSGFYYLAGIRGRCGAMVDALTFVWRLKSGELPAAPDKPAAAARMRDTEQGSQADGALVRAAALPVPARLAGLDDQDKPTHNPTTAAPPQALMLADADSCEFDTINEDILDTMAIIQVNRSVAGAPKPVERTSNWLKSLSTDYVTVRNKSDHGVTVFSSLGLPVMQLKLMQMHANGNASAGVAAVLKWAKITGQVTTVDIPAKGAKEFLFPSKIIPTSGKPIYITIEGANGKYHCIDYLHKAGDTCTVTGPATLEPSTESLPTP